MGKVSEVIWDERHRGRWTARPLHKLCWRHRHIWEIGMVEQRGLVRGNLDEKNVHVLIRKHEVMVALVAYGDAAGGVWRRSLSGESQCRNSGNHAEVQNRTET